MRRKEIPPCTINPELLKTWKKFQRKKDAPEIAALLKISRPVIDNALRFGHVTYSNELADQITTFFEERFEKEKQDANRLAKLLPTT